MGGFNSIVRKSILALSASDSVASRFLRWILILFVLALLLKLFWCLRLSSRDLQLGYWLGGLPTITFACLLVSLTLLAGGLAYAVHIGQMRIHERELKRLHGWQHNEVEHGVFFTLTTLRCILAAITILGIVNMVLAAVVMKAAATLSRSITPAAHGGLCGLGGASEAIELVHERLVEFHDECLQDPANDGKLVYQCPGFAGAFPDFPGSQPYAHYLAVTEKQYHCSGFCHVSMRTLFIHRHESVAAPSPLSLHSPFQSGMALMQAARSVQQDRRSCANSVGDYLLMWAQRVGTWSFVLGPFFVVIGMAFLMYDEL